MCVTKT